SLTLNPLHLRKGEVIMLVWCHSCNFTERERHRRVMSIAARHAPGPSSIRSDMWTLFALIPPNMPLPAELASHLKMRKAINIALLAELFFLWRDQPGFIRG